MTRSSPTSSKLIVDYCGEIHELNVNDQLVIGRDADVNIDDNQFLHRRFLKLVHVGGLWWVENVGSQLTASLADPDGLMQASLAPSARLPLVFDTTVVWFTAGPTAYEVSLTLDPPCYQTPREADPSEEPAGEVGELTTGRVSLTTDQHLLILALAEPTLRHGRRGDIPTSAAAAQRLGWAQTKFNRKLDNVCEKFTRLGVRGLQGSVERLASSRRARLVEYAVEARVVVRDELALLDRARTEA